MGTSNRHHPYLGPPVFPPIVYPKVTETMLRRCEERNVHLMDISHARTGCKACGRSEADIEERGPAVWRKPSQPVTIAGRA